MSSALASFSPATRSWFASAFGSPTEAQEQAWRAITAGEHALVIAPTGSGKTLAAFLAALDRLSTQPGTGTRVLYLSPLKALAVDVERNLQAPLRGIREEAQRLGLQQPEVRVGVRSGDTPPAERRRLVAKPPDILITTPESLFLMLTSAARETLRNIEAVIVDEVHVVASTKRGAHLSLSLERLRELVGRDFQRIGLSATVRPPERVASWLHANEPVRLIQPPSAKEWCLDVVVPVDDMADPGASASTPPDAEGPQKNPSIWPHIEERVLDLIEANRSTIVFANSRRLAERVTAHLNELHATRHGLDVPETVAPPAQLMAASDTTRGIDHSAQPVIARAHHGSVSKEQRAIIETQLKSGQLRCVVATSSLELGIDMGAVDLVIQLASPPSVASGLQRVGRAGHQVGAVSRGVFFPDHRGDLVPTAVVVERMRAGQIEEIAELSNPLDVLAQQIVAIASGGTITVEALYALVRRAANFTELPRSIFDAVLDMLAGRYPSEDFAELRPRLVWDREQGTVTGRPGAQRLAVTSGGTIPDRGLFGVFLIAGDEESAPRRVGELDEEMVHESRVGDIFALGTTTWRIEEITHDQVRVSPAPGQPGRVPFWLGDDLGRPAELGLAQGAFLRELSSAGEHAPEKLAALGFDRRSANNLQAYLDDQMTATGVLPTDQTILVERFRDDFGDWQLCVLSSLGTPVLRAWSLAIERRARELYSVDAHARASNDGIVLRLPAFDGPPPGVDLLVFDPDELEPIITDELGGSALFAARFRECAARALLLPRRDPNQRSPLWRQRVRSAQLLTVAAQYPDFPIILEAMRECLHDELDLPALQRLQRQIAARRVRLVEVETARPSPFTRSLLFGYAAEFIYQDDSPLAERKTAALSLDATLLAELLGTGGVSDLFEPELVTDFEAELQRLTPSRQAGTTEQLFDLLRTHGPLNVAELAERCSIAVAECLEALRAQRRIVEVAVAGEPRWCVVEDLARLRSVGVPLPAGFHAPADAANGLPDLVLRWARNHGPFVTATVSERYALTEATVATVCDRLADAGKLLRGRFTAPEQWCHPEVFGRLKRRALASLRAAVQPIEQQQYARFLPEWHSIGAGLPGVHAVAAAVDQLMGCPLPASMIEQVILPARVADYSPAMLDELLASGEVVWTGDGPLGAADGWVRLWPADLLADGPGPVEPGVQGALSPAATLLLGKLGAGGGWWFEELIADVELGRSDLEAGLWELVWAGLVRCDTLAPLRALTTDGALKSTPKPRPRSRAGMLRASRVRVRPPSSAVTTGRWSLASASGPRLDTELLLARLDRYGVLTKGALRAEQSDHSFGTVYRALSQLEDAGQCLRGYFIEGLGAAQFATAATVDRLREQGPTGAVLLAACDPANPYGAALPWPGREGHRPGRKAGAIVVLVDGALTVYAERGQQSLLTFTDDGSTLLAGLRCLAGSVHAGRLPATTVQRIDGEPALTRDPSEAHRRVTSALEQAGFSMNPQGYRVR